MGKKQNPPPEEAFDQYYESIYGERWPALKEALLQENRQQPFDQGLRKAYFLDPASVLCAQALGVQPKDRVLDLCAAPGGKSLVLASMLGGQGALTLNEKSPDRFHRLKRVFDEHFSPSMELSLSFRMGNGMVFGKDSMAYDKILVDAPCSSERHILHSNKHLERWTKGRTKTLSITQGGLLAAAADALAPGGTIVYSTCAISPQENDKVVAKILGKRSFLATQGLFFNQGEATKHGWIFLPDQCGGIGPMYLAKLTRNP
jgi:16S rRNA C967 or C1407 C5-methylase (RsmB/RsmF family)